MVEELGLRVVILGVAQARSQIGAIRSDLSRFAKEIGTSGTALSKFGLGMTRTGDAMVSLGRSLTFGLTLPLVGAIGALTKAGIDFEKAFTGVTKTVDGLSQGFNEVAKSMYGTSQGLSQVQKDAVFANESFGELTEVGKKVRQEFINMSLEIPIAANELARVGQVAGQLGVADTQVAGFTKIMAELGVTTDLSAEDASFAIARMANIMGIKSEDMTDYASKFGSAIVRLGNTVAATEPEIANLALRLASAGSVVGLTTPQILGLSAALAEVGVKSERGGTAISRIFYEMISASGDLTSAKDNEEVFFNSMVKNTYALIDAIKGGTTSIVDLNYQFEGSGLVLTGLAGDIADYKDGLISLETIYHHVATNTMTEFKGSVAESQKQIQLFAKISGISAEQFAILFKQDAAGALKLFVTNLAKLQDEGKVSKETLAELGLEGVRVREILNILGPNFELVDEAIAKANGEWSEQIALQEEFTKFSKTVGARLQILRNSFTAVGIAITDAIRDDLLRFINGLNALFISISKLDPAVLKWGVRLAGVAALLGPINVLLGTFLQVSGNAFIGFDRFGGVLSRLIKLPFSPFTRLFSVLTDFSKKGLLGKSTNALKTLFTGLFSFGGVPKSIANTVSKFFGGVFSKAFSTGSGLAKSGITLGKNVGGFILQGLTGVFYGPLKSILGIVFTPLKLLGSGIKGIFGFIAPTIKGTLGLFGSLFTTVLGKLPKIGLSIASNLLGPLKYLPTLLVAGGAAFTLLFAPKVVSQLIKNKDKVFGEIKTSFTQFQNDLKAGGLQKAILLFFSGGSTGSGREGGLLGISKALGASEESAKKFSYAMGVASFWIIKIVKATGIFVKELLFGKDAVDGIFGSTKSTSERLISLAAGIAKFFEGFFLGWTKSFSSIEAAFKGFTLALKENFGAVGRLFDTIFGGAKKQGSDLIQTLEPGITNGATSFGQTVGSILGEFITLALRGLQFIVQIATTVANAFTSIVTAYQAGGVKGVFEELGPILAGIWNGIIGAAAVLWDAVRPSLVSFATSAATWMITDAPGILATGISSLVSTLVEAFSNLWNGKEGIVASIQTPQFRSLAIQRGVSMQMLDATKGNTAPVGQQTGLQEGFVNLFNSIKDFIINTGGPALRDGMSQAWLLLINWINNTGKFLFENSLGAVFDWIKTDLYPNTIEPALTSAWASIKNFAQTTLIPGAAEQGTIAGTAFKNALIDAITPDDLANFIKDPLHNLHLLDLGRNQPVDLSNLPISDQESQALLKWATDNGIDIGETFTTELSNGILSKAALLYLNTQAMLLGLNTTVENVLGIGSPSTVFFSNGVSIMQGLINGIQSQRYVLQTALNGVLSQLYNFSSSINNIKNIIQSQLQSIFSFAQSILSLLSTTVSNALATITGSTVINNTTSSQSSTYAPQFIGPQPQQSYTQNSQMYAQYLLANQGVG